jgi:hypothetical protein
MTTVASMLVKALADHGVSTMWEVVTLPGRGAVFTGRYR